MLGERWRGLCPCQARCWESSIVGLGSVLSDRKASGGFGRDQASDGVCATKPRMWGKEVMMRKFYGLLALALLSVFAVGGYVASAAFAESEILANGNMILASEDLLFQILGELLLEDTGATGKPDILCTIILDGLFESGTLAFINEVLHDTGELLSATINDLSGSVEGDDVECVDMNNVCSSPVLLVAIHLPWHLQLELLAGDTEEPYMWDLLEETGKEPAYAIDCNTILGLIEDVCDGLLEMYLLDLGMGNVDAGFLPIRQGNCSQGGVGTNVFEGEGLIEDGTTMFSLS